MVLGAAGAAGGAWLGPPVMELVFGAGVRLPPGDAALVALGSVVALANLVVTVGLLARNRAGAVLGGWLAAVPCGAAALLLPLGDVLRSTCWAFVVVEVTAWACLVAWEGRSDRLVRGQQHRGAEGRSRRAAAGPRGARGASSTRSQRAEHLRQRRVAGPRTPRRREHSRSAANIGKTARERVGGARRTRSPAASTAGDEPSPGVAAVVPGPDVVVGPGPLVRRHGEQQPPARAPARAPAPRQRAAPPARSARPRRRRRRDRTRVAERQRQRASRTRPARASGRAGPGPRVTCAGAVQPGHARPVGAAHVEQAPRPADVGPSAARSRSERARYHQYSGCVSDERPPARTHRGSRVLPHGGDERRGGTRSVSALGEGVVERQPDEPGADVAR